ncbi:unnamed protein product [Meloidogyne enterolobii]|uniref:Uncharacterized protein n=1 Tax=Meloidogyne enterolobii TaxID=390850 RepID=A0ACB1AQQ2_MELEN
MIFFISLSILYFQLLIISVQLTCIFRPYDIRVPGSRNGIFSTFCTGLDPAGLIP